MKIFRKLFMLLLLVKAFEVNSQTDLFLDQNAIGLTFLEGTKIKDCKVCEEDFTYLDKKIKEMRENLSFKDMMDLLQAEFDKELVNNRKARILLIMINNLIKYQSDNPNVIYNLSHYDYFDQENLEKAKNGALELISLFDKAIDLAEDDISKKNIKMFRMHYIAQTNLYYGLDQLYGFNRDVSMDENIEDLNIVGTDKIILETLNKDYINTGFTPFKSYTGINLGVNYLNGRSNWLGSEISLDLVSHPNPFNIFSSKLKYDFVTNYSLLGFGLMKNLTQHSFDFNVYVLNIKKLGIVSANLFQFGYHKGYSHGNSLYYRPEIGLSYGPLIVSYGYNAIFKKSVRPFSDSHFITIKLNYPFIRISKYE